MNKNLFISILIVFIIILIIALISIYFLKRCEPCPNQECPNQECPNQECSNESNTCPKCDILPFSIVSYNYKGKPARLTQMPHDTSLSHMGCVVGACDLSTKNQDKYENIIIDGDWDDDMCKKNSFGSVIFSSFSDDNKNHAICIKPENMDYGQINNIQTFGVNNDDSGQYNYINPYTFL